MFLHRRITFWGYSHGCSDINVGYVHPVSKYFTVTSGHGLLENDWRLASVWTHHAILCIFARGFLGVDKVQDSPNQLYQNQRRKQKCHGKAPALLCSEQENLSTGNPKHYNCILPCLCLHSCSFVHSLENEYLFRLYIDYYCINIEIYILSIFIRTKHCAKAGY